MEFLGNQRECLDFWDLEDLKCFKFQAEKFSFSGLANDSKSQNEVRIKKYIDSCFHLF